MKKRHIILIFILLFVVSCNKQTNNFFVGDITSDLRFSETKKVEKQSLNFEDSSKMCLYNIYKVDSLFIGDYINNEFKFCIFNDKFEYISTLINIGRGENEMLFPSYIGLKYDNGVCYLYIIDINKKSVYKINFDKFINEKIYILEKVFDCDSNMFSATFLGNDKYIMLCYDVENNNMFFEILDENGEKIGRNIQLNNFPFKEIYANTSILFSASPDGRKIAMVSLSMNQLMILDVEKEENRIYTTDKKVVRWDIIEDELLPFDTYISLNTTAENIITAKNIIENEAFKGVSIEIWDWNGNPVRNYFINNELISLSYDEKSNSLYGVTVEEEVLKIKLDEK